ncbi:MAG TPA: aspartate carbamoyltransferase catalytic subunit [Rhizomicrobium sp.]|jgi:aspartate carbamoyltransferase catalytic subunit|nr:aspartate carbamoyltransferase catalytic subunit [Rhizomicrobium sp.]
MAKDLPPLRHVISINDLSNTEIERIFSSAADFLERLSNPATPYRISRSVEAASGQVLATLFYEPSTRTRLSFESAMLRLGGRNISSADPATSSAAKGESLADTVRVISSYADALVIRHPRDGAARLAAEYAEVPVINGGDGSHEHPTQTLCDLFTLQREKGKLKDLNVVISGDLHGSRTIHSFVYALARFQANIMLMPGGRGMQLPSDVDWRLRNEFHSHPVPKTGSIAESTSGVDAVYKTADQPHQLALIPLKDEVDIFYMTRFQKERWVDGQRNDYMRIDKRFLDEERYRHASVLHPLPRVGEMDMDLDQMPRAAYFRQAAFGVPVRMALIAALLDLDGGATLGRFHDGFGPQPYPVHEQPRALGLVCPNSNCITHDEHDGGYAGNRFYVVQIGGTRLRCFYCESDLENVVAGSRNGELAYFANGHSAAKAGYATAGTAAGG